MTGERVYIPSVSGPGLHVTPERLREMHATAGLPMPAPNIPGEPHDGQDVAEHDGPDPGEPEEPRCPVSVYAGSFGHVRCHLPAPHCGQHQALIRWSYNTGYPTQDP